MTELDSTAMLPEERDGQISLLLDLMGEINHGADTNRVFSLIADTLHRMFDIDRFAVSLKGEKGLPTIVASKGLSAEYIAAVSVDRDDSPGLRVMATRTSLFLLDAPTSEAFSPFQEAAAREGVRTILLLPLLTGGEVFGLLAMFHDQIRPYSAGELALAQGVATQAGVAMAQARLLEDVQERREELERQYQQRIAEAEATDRISLRIAASLDLEGTFGVIVDASAQLTGARSSSLYLLGEDGTYRAVAAYGISLAVLQGVALTSESGLMKEMCVTREPVQVLDFRKEVQNVSEGVRSFVEQLDVRATLGVPLVDGEECVGALYIAQEGNEPFSDDAVRMLRRLAAFAQVAVRNAERYTFLQSEQNRLQGYVDAIPEGVLVLARDGTVALANAALQRELGARQPLRGVNRHELFSNAAHFLAAPVRFRFDHDAAFDRVLSSGQPEQGLLEVGVAPRKFEVQYSPIQRPDGEIEGVVATMRDITSPLELQSERARTHLLSELLSLSAHLNSELSIPVLIERVVEAAMELVGASAGTLGLVEGDVLVFRRYHLPGGWADFQYQVQRGEGAPGHVWETGKPYITNTTRADEYVLQPVRQRLGFNRLAYVPVFDRSGKIIGTLGVYDPKVERDFDQSDIEALQLLAHQAAIAIENARLNELKDEFLSIVSHELKTPVTSIKGFTQILHRRLPDDVLEGSRRYLDVINHQADRLTGLINDLLDLSRIQTGRFVFDVDTIDYGELVRDVLTEMRLISPQLSMTYAGPEHLSLRGNADRIRQVLVNLIDNGMNHGPTNGAIHVTVKVGDDMVNTYVCDEGKGLPPGEEERIFAQYYQVRHGSERHARGLGLGLFISRQIIEALGGRIWLDEADHTSFCFTIPLAENGAAPHEELDVHLHGTPVT